MTKYKFNIGVGMFAFVVTGFLIAHLLINFAFWEWVILWGWIRVAVALGVISTLCFWVFTDKNGDPLE